ncbi:rRNA-processing protein UTP23-like [Quillaja saponaria]|uniref:rRNA-processing protein UTP23-like n=1 Tax=Quillaja saponaria TaxID=32244 RepID=A0AAD7PNF5_QUISA|nr:rRNA-processing protein UTP23-like [Quillaja saponaria]
MTGLDIHHSPMSTWVERSTPSEPQLGELDNCQLNKPQASYSTWRALPTRSTRLEYKTLKKRLKKSSEDEEAIHFSEEIMAVGDKFLGMQDLTKMHTAKNQMDKNDIVQFKRKKAKGPNPLSCKKKKNRENQSSVLFKATVCQQCGARGYPEALVYCHCCHENAEHRYCFSVLPSSFTEDIIWYCEDCKQKIMKSPTLVFQHSPCMSSNAVNDNSKQNKETIKNDEMYDEESKSDSSCGSN